MNPYFKHQNIINPEFDIYKNAANEIIEQRGLILKYLERNITDDDIILGDTLLSQFDTAIETTLYMENYTSFDGDGNLFGTFGFEMSDQMTLLISQIKLNELKIDPKESDILFHEISNRMFEIVDVKDSNTFYQFARDSYWKKIVVKPFNLNHEDFNTGNTTLDVLENLTNSSTENEMDVLETARSLFLDED